MLKLDFDWAMGVVVIDVSNCSVEDVNRIVTLTEQDHPHKTCVVNGDTLTIDTALLEDVFRHLVPNPEVTVEWSEWSKIPF